MSKLEWYTYKGRSYPLIRPRQVSAPGFVGPSPEETLYGDSASVAQAPPPPLPRLAKRSGQARRKPPSVPNRATNAPPSPTATIPKPAYREQAIGMELKNWNAWSQKIGGLPKLHSTEKRAYMDIFAAEGGNSYNSKSKAMSGIKDKTLDELIEKKYVKGIKKGTKSHTLSLDKRAGIYRNYFDFALNMVGGSSAFGRFGDSAAASASRRYAFQERPNRRGTDDPRGDQQARRHTAGLYEEATSLQIQPRLDSAC